MKLPEGQLISFEKIQSLFSQNENEPDNIWYLALDFFFNEKQEIILHTSGSTGNPKPLVLNRRAIFTSAQSTGTALKFKPEDIYLICLPIERIGGFMALIRALVYRMNIVWIPPSTTPISRLKEINPELRIQFASSVPAQIEDYLKNQDLLIEVKQILIGGAPISPELEEEAAASHIPFLTTFGMTETLSHIAWRPLGQAVKRFITLPGVTIRSDNDGNLEIKGSVTQNQWVQTKDQVEILNSNSFIWKGRNDFVINTGGHKVRPEELENTIRNLLEVLKMGMELIVSSISDEQWGERIVAVFEGEEPGKKLQEKINFLLKSSLPKHHVPRHLFFIKSFPITPGGKVDRIRIRNWITRT